MCRDGQALRPVIGPPEAGAAGRGLHAVTPRSDTSKQPATRREDRRPPSATGSARVAFKLAVALEPEAGHSRTIPSIDAAHAF